jgi:multiple antibiotic resistance protein
VSMGCRRVMTLLVTTYFVLALTALLPLINPVGSALVFLGLVGDETPKVYRNLARRVAITMFIFLLTIEYLGSYLLGFFSLSLPIVQVTGGLVLASNGWRLLFEQDANAHTRNKGQEIGAVSIAQLDDLSRKIFYPFTFPITAGPGALVVVLTLSAHASANAFVQKATAHAGIAIAAVALSILVYLCYGYAPRLIQIVSPATAHGILRIIAFLLMCIGVQLLWNGLTALWVKVPGR